MAGTLAGQLFEADAEFMLLGRYPERAAQSASHYLELQLERVPRQQLTKQPPPLQPFELLGHRLRLQLGVMLVRDLKGSRRVVDLLTMVDRELGRLVSDDDDLTWNRLETVQHLLSPSRPNFATMSEFGPDAYWRAVEVVIEAAARL